MASKYWLITPDGPVPTSLTGSNRAIFREDAIEIAMYAVGEGEVIVVRQGGETVLVDGGSGTGTDSKDSLAQAMAGQIEDGSITAVVSSHPHQDHSNAYIPLVKNHAELFADGARFFDSNTQRAPSLWKLIKSANPDMPLTREPDTGDQYADTSDSDLLSNAFTYLFRGSTKAKSPNTQVYWSVFMLLRYGDAWMLFTGDVNSGAYEKAMVKWIHKVKQAEDPTGDLFVDLLKITHHGSDSGTTEKFVEGTKPKLAIVSSVADDDHKLEDDVITRLGNCEISATYEEGRTPHETADVIVRTDGFIWTVGSQEGVLYEVTLQKPALT